MPALNTPLMPCFVISSKLMMLLYKATWRLEAVSAECFQCALTALVWRLQGGRPAC